MWLSNQSRIKWCAPTDKETPTFEERTFPEQYEEQVDLMDAAKRLESRPEQDWRIFRHGVATKDVVEEERLKNKEARYDYPEEEESPKTDNSTDVDVAREHPTLLQAHPGREGAKCAMDLRPFHAEEDTGELQPSKSHKDAKCAMELRPFIDEDEECMEVEGERSIASGCPVI